MSTRVKVQYEEMFPRELEERIRKFPVAYVPVGSLEWHGRHLALGNDTIKAHGILVRTAQKYGGVVVPGTYWGHMAYWKPGCHPGLSVDLVDQLYTEIFKGLVIVGFKVVIGVTGHDVKEQVASLQKAVEAISADGKACGFAMMEGSLNEGDPNVGMDHAAKWETSYLMVLRPDLVDMERVRHEDLESEPGGKEAGIEGMDPRVYASKEVGERAIELMADRIGQKAQELVASLQG